jgi:hypothetical protein
VASVVDTPAPPSTATIAIASRSCLWVAAGHVHINLPPAAPALLGQQLYCHPPPSLQDNPPAHNRAPAACDKLAPRKAQERSGRRHLMGGKLINMDDALADGCSDAGAHQQAAEEPGVVRALMSRSSWTSKGGRGGAR